MSKQNVIEFDAELWTEWVWGIRIPKKVLVKDHGVKKLSLLKWHPDNPNRGMGVCPACLKFIRVTGICSPCPLYSNTCSNYKSNNPQATYWKWYDTKGTEESEKYADLMYKAISEIEED